MPLRHLLVTMLCTCAPSASATEILTLDGLNPVRIGMTKREAENVLGVKLKLQGDSNCATADRPDKKVWYMFEKFRVVRIDVDAKQADITSEQGLAIGSTEKALKKAFGRNARFSEHPYMSPDGHYVEIKFPGKNRLLLFETYHGKITSFRVGLPDSVRLIEGCS
jgi:hypothetical protein